MSLVDTEFVEVDEIWIDCRFCYGDKMREISPRAVYDEERTRKKFEHGKCPTCGMDDVALDYMVFHETALVVRFGGDR